MKNFHVVVELRGCDEFDVKANSKEEAQAKAEEMIQNGEFDFGLDEFEVSRVWERKEEFEKSYKKTR